MKVALRVALLAAGLLLADFLAAQGLAALYAHSGASPMALVAAERPDTVVVGTSTAKSALNPAHWPGKLLNLAEDGQTVFYSIAAARALSEAPSVKRIVIAIDPGDLRSGLDNPSAKRVWKIAPLIAAIPDVAPLLSQTRAVTEAPYFLTSWRFRGEVGEIISKLGKTKPKPYRPLLPGDVAEPRPEGPADPATAKIHTTVVPYLDVLSRVARDSDKQIILTIAPVYRMRYSDRPGTAALLAGLRHNLASAPVCDLMEAETLALATLRADPANFHDTVHHTEAGGRLFTIELARLVAERCKK